MICRRENGKWVPDNIKKISKEQMEIVKEIRGKISKAKDHLLDLRKRECSASIRRTICNEINCLNKIYTSLEVTYKEIKA